MFDLVKKLKPMSDKTIRANFAGKAPPSKAPVAETRPFAIASPPRPSGRDAGRTSLPAQAHKSDC